MERGKGTEPVKRPATYGKDSCIGCGAPIDAGQLYCPLCTPYKGNLVPDGAQDALYWFSWRNYRDFGPGALDFSRFRPFGGPK